MFLNDQETATDLLYFEAISKTVVRLIDASKNDPLTIGIHGDWGAGKSSILKMIQSSWKGDDGTLCLWFNGWTFEGFDDAKTVVIETVVEELTRARPKMADVKEAASRLRKRIDWLKLARKTGGLALTAFSGIPTKDLVSDAVDLVKQVVDNPREAISIEKLREWASTAGEFVKDAPEETAGTPGHMHAFREEFVALLDAAQIKRLVVMVDDLDRCLPSTAIATLEAIRLFLFVERTAFIIGADEAMIEYAVKDHFPDLPPSSGPVTYSRNYLEKLIQVPFRIPALGAAETRIYVSLLLVENALGSDDPTFALLISVARDQLKKPWLIQGLDRSAIEAKLGRLPGPIENALAISAQVSAVLSEGAHGNPRQIKRFLNTLMLREAIAEERGFAEDIERSTLAKIMLAERFAPSFYGDLAKLAAGDINGAPKAIAALEGHLKVRGVARSAGAMEEESIEPSSEVGEWLASEWIVRWAKTEPKLAGKDLRPYVFVTRDKRSALSGVAAHQHLEALIEKLMAGRIAVAQSAEDVSKLTGMEPETVFNALRDNILASDKPSKKPDGVDGLALLVEIHPALQGRLVELLEALPTERIGTWAVSSWSKALQSDNWIDRFDLLKEQWAKQSENKPLQSAAKASKSLPRVRSV
jgi:predicted KAP-like P-loop ATPase